MGKRKLTNVERMLERILPRNRGPKRFVWVPDQCGLRFHTIKASSWNFLAHKTELFGISFKIIEKFYGSAIIN